MEWSVEDFVVEQPHRAVVTIEGRTVQLRAWRYEVRGMEGTLPVYLLDTDLPENGPFDRSLTGTLYGGDERYRLCQEALLGIGGVRMLRALGYDQLHRFHMNEGHSSLLALELLAERQRGTGRTVVTADDVQAVRGQCVFTTHTPVPAGQDQFPMQLAMSILEPGPLGELHEHCCAAGLLNLTQVGLSFSHYVNGVAMRHGEVSRKLFGDYTVDAITNGVHAASWAAPVFRALYDRHIPGWRRDNFSLRYALSISREEIWEAHCTAKRDLGARLGEQASVRFDPEVFTIGFARRATAYKRADLLLQDIERLKAIAAARGGLQIVYGGKAHPLDGDGKRSIETIFRAQRSLAGSVSVFYVENYDLHAARQLVAGVDLWVNTPLPPLEASGTSGMKAALNGVPSLSILDGWWIEGHVEGVTGWSIGDRNPVAEGNRTAADAASLYDKLDHVIMPLFHQHRDEYTDVMRHAIAMNGSFFNCHRMLEEYVLKAYAT